MLAKSLEAAATDILCLLRSSYNLERESLIIRAGQKLQLVTTSNQNLLQLECTHHTTPLSPSL